MDIAYYNICGRRNIRYTFIRYIIMVNNNYFKIRWNGKEKYEEEIMKYDDMRDVNIIIMAN
jgi:hypothetical protein